MTSISVTDDDFAIALKLSQELNESDSPVSVINDGPRARGDKEMSCVDPRWETLDPIPDIRGLFLEFNTRFFGGQLAGIEVRWSPRMTLCAGLCCYEGRGGLCSVRLSVPLLKLRPRKDLVETLLHEMIHAYLFVTDNNKDHDGHGPEFCKHMHRINKATGANISIYHNFHDEVNVYRQHWWHCDGPCKTRKPYYGYVKRSMNREPSHSDTWWAEHQRTCGGKFIKVKEPENYKKKEKKNKDQNIKKIKTNVPGQKVDVSNKNMDIRIFGGKGNCLDGSTSQKNTSGDMGSSQVISNGVIQKSNNGKGNCLDGSTSRTNTSGNLGSSQVISHVQKSSNKVSTVTSSSANKQTSNDNYGKNIIINGILKKDDKDSDKNCVAQNTGDLRSNKRASGNNGDCPAFGDKTNIVMPGNTHQMVREKLREVWGKRKMQTTTSTSRVATDVALKPSSSDRENYGKSSDSLWVTSETGKNVDLNFKHSESFSKKTTSTSQPELSSDNDVNIKNKNRALDTSRQSVIHQKECGKKRPRDSDSETRKKKKQKLSSETDDQKIDSLFKKVFKKYDIKTKDNEQAGDESENVTSEELQTCPVCSKTVPASSINSHLDKCLAIL